MYICSHMPGYELTTEQMVNENQDGKESVQSLLRGLEEKGYLKRIQRHLPEADATKPRKYRKGTFDGYDYVLQEPDNIPAPRPFEPRRRKQDKTQPTVAGKPVNGSDQGFYGGTVAGFSVDGSSVDGSSVDGEPARKGYQGLEDQGLEDQREEDHPLLLLDDAAATQTGDDRREEDQLSGDQIQTRTDALIAELTEIMATKPIRQRWKYVDQRTRSAIAKLFASGRTFDQAAAALMRFAEETQARDPREVLGMPASWWAGPPPASPVTGDSRPQDPPTGVAPPPTDVGPPPDPRAISADVGTVDELVAAVRRIRPGWRPEHTRPVIERLLASGEPLALVTLVAQYCARDTGNVLPIVIGMPGEHWDRAAARLASPPPAPTVPAARRPPAVCETCDGDAHLPVPDGYVPCPDCHDRRYAAGRPPCSVRHAELTAGAVAGDAR